MTPIPRALPNPTRAALVALLLPVAAAAQSQFEHSLQYSYLPLDQDTTRALAHGDVDGDGDLDVVVGNDSSASLPTPQTRLLLNDGRGVLTDVTGSRLPADSAPTTAVALVDVDGDGDLDLVIGKLAAQNRLYRNDGSGTFTDVTASSFPVDTARTVAIAVGDTDGDGDVDIVFANSWPSGRQNFLYENDGSGGFVNVTSSRLPMLDDPTSDVALADFDGDGDLDLLTVNGAFDARDRMMWNDGTGTFSLTGGPALPPLFDRAVAVTVADIDGDLDLDYVVGNRVDLPFYDGSDRVMVNDGSGSFTDETASRLTVATGNTGDLQLGDVDGDLDPDLVVAIAGQNRLYINDGTGVFVAATTPLPVHDDASRAVVVLDIDGDGDDDLMWGNDFFGSARQNRLYLNDGAGGFSDTTLPRLPIFTSQGKSPFAFDADGDGDLDLVTVSEFSTSGAAVQLFVNDGRGVFEKASAARLPAVSGNVRDVVAGDFDGDGDEDLVLAMGSTAQSLFLANDGTGTFTDETSRLPVGTHTTEAVATADIDGDGDLDLVLGNQFGVDPNLLYLNDGTGVFTVAIGAAFPIDTDWAGDLKFGDIDGDGDLDLVIANEQTQNRLYLNSGVGAFLDVTASAMPPDSDRSVAVTLGDVDGDGDLDIVFGNSNERQNRLYLNDGSGLFSDATATKLPIDDDSTEGVALGDIDGDGDLDLVVGNRGPGFLNRLLVNDGAGGFTQTEFDELRNLTSDVVFADFDGDGDPDVVQTNNGEQLLMVNRLRQLTVPVFPQVGRSLALDICLRPGVLQQPAMAVPLLSFTRSPSAVRFLPFGSIWLAPPAVTLPAVALPSPAGTTTVTLPIPANTALVDVELHAQALLFDPGDSLVFRLTNLVSARIQR